MDDERFGMEREIRMSELSVFDDGQKRSSEKPQNRGNRGGASRVHRFPHIRENNAAMSLKTALKLIFRIGFGFTV